MNVTSVKEETRGKNSHAQKIQSKFKNIFTYLG